MEAKAACRRPGSKNYSREFREAVVAQANNPARSLAEVAQEYGLNANLISRWRRIHQQRFYFPGAPRSLKLCCSDGTVEIDSNVAENALRCVALRRRNFIFAGSDSGGDRAAAMYSFIATHKLNDIEPRAYLCHVLSRIAAHPVSKRLGPTVFAFARASGMMVMVCRSPCRSREIVSTIGDRGHDPSKSTRLRVWAE
ncbi:transposase [Burkholderia sp. Ch1-1]|nr:transposase [Burkholderia sp. Ch1-1]